MATEAHFLRSGCIWILKLMFMDNPGKNFAAQTSVFFLQKNEVLFCIKCILFAILKVGLSRSSVQIAHYRFFSSLLLSKNCCIISTGKAKVNKRCLLLRSFSKVWVNVKILWPEEYFGKCVKCLICKYYPFKIYIFNKVQIKIIFTISVTTH